MWGKTVKANKVKKDVDILRESRCNFRNSQFFAAPPLTSALPPLCPFPAQPVPLPSRPDFRLKTAQLRCNAMQCTATGQWSRHYAPRTASQPSMAHHPGCCAILQDVMNLLSDISWCGLKTWYVCTTTIRYLICYNPQWSIGRRVGQFFRWEEPF